ncbi:MAG: hypothetical protein ACXVI4_04200 [Halobacteriota archaeon]
MRLKSMAAIVVISLVAALLLVYCYTTITSTPAYEFNTSVSPPRAVNDLLANGTVTLLFTDEWFPLSILQ